MGKPKISEEEQHQLVLDFMTKSNRPYNAIPWHVWKDDVHTNLYTSSPGKTAVAKALVCLAEKQLLVEKVYGKQKIYFVDQSQFQSIDTDTIEKELKEVETLLDDLKETKALLEAEVKTLIAEPKTDEADSILRDIASKSAAFSKDVATMEELVSNVSSEDRKETNTMYSQCLREVKKRKRMANTAIDVIMETYPKKVKELYEDIGFETDSDVGFHLRNYS